MWGIIGIVTVSIGIFMLDGIGLRKKKQVKDIVVFTVLLAFGTGLAIAQALHWNIPNPLEGLRFLFEPAGKWMISLMETKEK